VAEYTVGGGWQTIYRELKKKREAAKLAQMGMRGWELPPPMGPQTAKVKVVVILNRRNPCHKEMADSWVSFFKPYADRVRVVFKDMEAESTRQLLAGIPIGCEAAMLVNGLNTIRVPWQKEPLVLQGGLAHGHGPEQALSPPQLQRLLQWALTPAGCQALKKQQAAFAKERQRRVEKEAAQEAGRHGAPQPPSAPAASASAPAAPPATQPARR
jgi:hypothetical protein